MLSNLAAISLTNVSKTYRTGAIVAPVLKQVSFQIPNGQSTAFVGPSGSGKSTLLALIAGLDSPDTGSISLFGQVVDGWSELKLSEFRSSNVGIVFQSYRLVTHLTALENVALPLEIQGRSEARDRARELLSELGMGHRIDHYPNQLSGGEQQRVAVARAVIHRPRLIVADEPTGNLDSKSGESVMTLLLEFSKKSTLVMVTHDLQLARRLDRQIHVRDGYVTVD